MLKCDVMLEMVDDRWGQALQRKADGGVTSDWEAAAASANLGGAISQHRPRSKIVRDISILVDRLMAPAGAQRGRAA